MADNTRATAKSIDEVLKQQNQLRDDVSKQIAEVNHKIHAAIQSNNDILQSNQEILQFIRVWINKQSANPAIESPTLNPAIPILNPVSENMTSWVGKDKIVVQTGAAKRSDFYIVDLRDNKVMKLRGGFLWNHNIVGGLIAAGSVIYAIGNPYRFYDRGYSEKPDDVDDDDYHIHSGASFLDLEDPSGSCWKGIGGMLNCYRSFPRCASLGDKIFVFGAGAGNSPWPFGEFYDKKNGSWQPIPISGIDHKMRIACPVISDPKHNRILVYFDLLTSLYAYYPDNNHQWVCLDDHMLSWRGQPAPSPVDDVLYFIISHTDYNNCITAYDILTKKCLEVSWSSCSPFGPHILDQIDFTQMLYLGCNILCLTTTRVFGDLSTRVIFWEYYRFQVLRVSQQKVLLTPLSVHRLPIEGRMSQRDAIAL